MADEKIVSKADNDKKSAKPEKSSKPGIFRRIGKFFRDTKSEFSKIVWPTLPSVVRNTLVTLAVCAVLGAIIFVVDFGLGALLDWVISLKDTGAQG